MNLDHALDGLLDLLAEAVVRELETQIPAALAGTRIDISLAKGDLERWKDSQRNTVGASI